MNKLILPLLFSCALLSAAPPQKEVYTPPNKEITAWLVKEMAVINKIIPGSTRAELSKLFNPMGGISPIHKRTYCYKKCLLIRVDVEFEKNDARTWAPEDKIVKISKPYLDLVFIVD